MIVAGQIKLFYFFFKNEEIFVKLDELDELDRITYARIGFKYSLTQAQKTVWCKQAIWAQFLLKSLIFVKFLFAEFV